MLCTRILIHNTTGNGDIPKPFVVIYVSLSCFVPGAFKRKIWPKQQHAHTKNKPFKAIQCRVSPILPRPHPHFRPFENRIWFETSEAKGKRRQDIDEAMESALLSEVDRHATVGPPIVPKD